jgi:hypothetical protein
MPGNGQVDAAAYYGINNPTGGYGMEWYGFYNPTGGGGGRLWH